MTRDVRSTGEPEGLGLSCTLGGLSLAGVPLLRWTRAGFAPRPAPEIASLFAAAYGADGDPTRFQASLGVIAQALNSGDLARALVAAVLMRAEELSPQTAERLAKVDRQLAQDDPDQPSGDDGDEPLPADPDGALGEEADDDDTGEPATLEQLFKREYDVGPSAFAERVITFGDRLAREGKRLSPREKERAVAEYSFLQDRLCFWLGYDCKPPKTQGKLFAAAEILYDGAVEGGIVPAGDLPRSLVDFDGGSGASDEDESAEPPDRKEQEELWEAEFAEKLPEVMQFPAIAGFRLFDPVTREAISAQTLNTLDGLFKVDHKIISVFLKRCVEALDDTEPRLSIGLDPQLISSKTIHLAIPDLTLPAQWLELYRAIAYGKKNGVSIVITRIVG